MKLILCSFIYLMVTILNTELIYADCVDPLDPCFNLPDPGEAGSWEIVGIFDTQSDFSDLYVTFPDGTSYRFILQGVNYGYVSCGSDSYRYGCLLGSQYDDGAGGDGSTLVPYAKMVIYDSNTTLCDTNDPDNGSIPDDENLDTIDTKNKELGITPDNCQVNRDQNFIDK